MIATVQTSLETHAVSVREGQSGFCHLTASITDWQSTWMPLAQKRHEGMLCTDLFVAIVQLARLRLLPLIHLVPRSAAARARLNARNWCPVFTCATATSCHFWRP